MRISQEADYAIRIILSMSKLTDKTKIEADLISETSRIPKRFTLKIMRKLVQAGLIQSFRGNNGGYSLLKQPEDISLKEVIEVIDGKISINKCLQNKAICNLNSENYCPVHETLGDIQQRFIDELNAVNFKDLAKKQ